MLLLKRIGQPILREIAQGINREEIQEGKVKEWVEEMWKTMEKEGGVGLAAPQIGISKRLFVASYPEAGLPPTVFCNPSISVLRPNKSVVLWESCLSIPNYWFDRFLFLSLHSLR